jgi:hypothetical protein
MFRSKKVIHKPSRACAQQLTEVSPQSDEWYRNAYGTNIQTFIFIYIDYWVSGLCPSPGILNTRKHKVSEIGSVFVLRGGEGDTYYVGSLRKSRPRSLYEVQKLNNSECYTPSLESFRFYQQFSCLPYKPLISLWQLFKL